MKILMIGGGGREHALCWKLQRDGHQLWCAPGNPGIAEHAECLDIRPHALADIERAAIELAVELVVVGPEAPLVAGLADRLRAAGVAVFGPGAEGARLEGSKVFCKQFLERQGIRTAPFVAVERAGDIEQAVATIAALGTGVVVKADGLAAGKGVVVCATTDQAMQAARERLAREPDGALVIEQRIVGRELSVMAITDGRVWQVLAQAEDHKAALDGDRGPNTGGMGSVSPCHWVPARLIARIEREVFAPTLTGLANAGIDYRGVLYAGLMIDEQGAPWMLEYNCRFGDPEIQSIVCRLRGDLGHWLHRAATGALPSSAPSFDPRTAVCVVLASEGYPGTATTGRAIAMPPELPPDTVVFQAGTAVRDGRLATSGGRVLGVTALGADVQSARARVYGLVPDTIHFQGMHYRSDIGARVASSRASARADAAVPDQGARS